MGSFKIEHYLDRIGLTDVSPGANGLAAVQSAHMRAIPFENIDPLLGQVPSLALDAIAAKLVAGGRGGYCFEHNALLGHVLKALGYAPRAVLARVFDPAGRRGARSHHAFTVAAQGDLWLCDTGFGGHGALTPMRLTTQAPQTAPNGTYRVRVDAATGDTTLDRQTGEAWVPLYTFDAAPVRDIDFEAANYLCACWPGAPFSANLMVAFHSDAGRISLFNRARSRGMPSDIRQDTLVSHGDLAEVLRTGCELDLADTQIAQIWAKIENAPTGR